MHRRTSLFVVALLAAVSPFAQEIRYEPSPDARARVIVEFAGPPRAVAHGSVAASLYRNTFQRFRADLAQIDPVFAKTGSAPPIAQEYSTVFFATAVDVPRGAVGRLRSLPYVVAVHEDTPVEKHADGIAHDAAERVNALGLGSSGRGVRIGIIDTGVDYNHPAIAPNYGGGYDFVNKDSDPLDDEGHGTHVAGIAAGNSAVIRGVAPEATIIAYKVLGSTGSGSTSNIIAAIERAADPNGDGDTSDHLDVINLSLGSRSGTPDHPMARAIDNVVAAGVTAVVSAGNSSLIGTVGTPGTARRAITVAALNTAGTDAASFSSRGPTPGLMTHKPDVAAPGSSIISAKLGGGTVALSGTSMAAPHVAGAAAVLLALHRNWTPDDVKSALIATAGLLQSDGYSRGAGKIDVAAAVNPVLAASDSGLSFGVLYATTGSQTLTRTFRVRNRGASTQSLTITAPDAPLGAVVTTTPQTLELAAGESAEVTVRIVTDNVRLRPPTVVTQGGTIVLSGASQLVVPWTFVRAARATVSYDGTLPALFAFSSGGLRVPVPLDGPSAELYTPVGISHDLLLLTSDPDTRVSKLVGATATFNAEETMSMSVSAATIPVELDARDVNGTLLSELPRTGGSSEYYGVVRFSTIGAVTANFGPSRILTSAIPQGINLDPFEIYLDVAGLKGYVANYARMSGLTQSVTLANEPYVHARLRWPAAARKPAFVSTCWVLGDTGSSATSFTTGACIRRSSDEPFAFDLFTTPEANSKIFAALAFSGTGHYTPPFRAWDGAIVASFEPVPGAMSFRIPTGGEAVVTNGPYFPFQFFGTTGSLLTSLPPPGFTGPLGEMRTDAMAGGHYTMRDEKGEIVASGPLDSIPLVAPRISTGFRYSVVSGNFTVAGRPSRGSLDVVFNSDPKSPDGVAPTLTSLRLLDANGNPTDVVGRGEAAVLRFSAADYAYESPGVVGAIASKADATKVFFRISGTRDWRPLSASKSGTETGARNQLRHMAYGDMFNVGMSEATAVGDVMIDLRIDIEDASANKLTWTQEPAFAVGAPSRPVRRRALPH